MPPVLVVVAAGVLGLIVGSFLNVVIWRVPRGESINHPASHCPACGHPIRPRDNIPVVSWMLLRGRCRDCGVRISWRYPAVEVLTAVVFAVVAAGVGLSVLLIPALWFAGACIALALIDLDVQRLPNAIMYPSYVVVGAGLVLTAVVQGAYADLLRSVLAAVALGAFYFLLALIYPGGMGLGDVKLAVLIGAVLGWVGWAEVIVGTFLGFLLGAVVGIVGMIAGKAGRKTRIPFGPFMILGTILSLFVATPLVGWYSEVLM